MKCVLPLATALLCAGCAGRKGTETNERPGSVSGDALPVRTAMPVTVEEIETMAPRKLTAGRFGTCYRAFITTDGKEFFIGSPAAPREVIRFLSGLEEGKTYDFPKVFKEYQKYPTYESGEQVKAMPRCRATAVDGGLDFLFFRTADGKGFWIGSPWEEGHRNLARNAPHPAPVPEVEAMEVIRFVRSLEEGKTYQFPDAFLEYKKAQQVSKP